MKRWNWVSQLGWMGLEKAITDLRPSLGELGLRGLSIYVSLSSASFLTALSSGRPMGPSPPQGWTKGLSFLIVSYR